MLVFPPACTSSDLKTMLLFFSPFQFLLMAKKKRPAAGGQMPLGAPPEASQDIIHYWSTYKTWYPAFLILLLKEDYYVTLDWDARTVHEITDHPLVEDAPELCYFPARDLDHALRKLTARGFFVAICYPPEKPQLHQFT